MASRRDNGNVCPGSYARVRTTGDDPYSACLACGATFPLNFALTRDLAAGTLPRHDGRVT